MLILLVASRVIFGGALIALFFIDLRQRRLPNIITIPGTVIGFLFSLVTLPGWRSSLLGIVIGGGLPFVIAEAYYHIRKQDGVGMGDVKMLAMIGAFLGWRELLFTLLLGSLLGTCVGLLQMLRGRADLRTALPFGTMLAVAAAVVEMLAAIARR